MSLQTRITDLFGLKHPIVLAPMGGVSGGKLAAAVSKAGGLGMIGGGYGDPAWLSRELDLVVDKANAPWGVGLITWCVTEKVLQLVLGYRPCAVMLSFGDSAPWAAIIKSAGAKLICQVQDLKGARAAVAAGADVIVAQGSEGGGHGGIRASFPLIPAIVDAVSPIPTIAAGGIADGRGIAAALVLGAQGVLIGTRFYATHEAIGNRAAKQRIVSASGDDSIRTQVFDIVRRYTWPEEHAGRALKNAFAERWHGREDVLRFSLPVEAPHFKQAVDRGDYDTAMVWAGECVDLIDRVEHAPQLMRRLARDAEDCLRRGSAFCARPSRFLVSRLAGRIAGS